ncbi:MAG: TRAP transporter small permease [Cytophagales bacterium]|nr:TRAP transporter small permease [Cytophagales bacterium]
MKLRNSINTALGWTLAFLMAVMVLNVLWQVFTRYVIGIPSSFTDELARYLLIWIGILGAAYAAGRRIHVAIDILPSRLSPRSQAKLLVFVNVVIIIFALTVLVIGGSRLVYITFLLKQNSPALQIPLGGVYTIIPVSGLLVVYYKISDLLNIK